MNNDRIERETVIAASLQTVWELISQPAWWVGDKPGPDSVEMDGARMVAHTRFGVFPVIVEQSDPPKYLACQWASSFPGEEPRQGNSTLVEFKLTEMDSGTLLRVIESGFSKLNVPEEEQYRFFKENINGWEFQLDVLRKSAEN